MRSEVYMMSLEHLGIPDSNKAIKHTRMMSKELRSQYGESSIGQTWDNLRFSEDNKYNGLKYIK